MKIKTWVGLMIALLLTTTLVMGACATTQGVPRAQPMPEGASYTGLWYSEEFRHMYLYQDGNEVTGIYAHNTGGTIEGEVSGNVLTFSWEEPGSREHARRTMRGQGYFQLVEDGDKLRLDGEWGYNENRRGGGPWTAEFIRDIEDGDPADLEALRSRH